MIPPLPLLDEYGISPEYGFLPRELPLDLLPDPYYNRWETVVANMQALLLSKRLRGIVDSSPVLSTSRLQHPAEWRRAYMLLAFTMHAYIWGGDKPEEVDSLRIVHLNLTDRAYRESRHQFPFLSSRYPDTSKYHQLQPTLVPAYGTLDPCFQTSPWTASQTSPH